MEKSNAIGLIAALGIITLAADRIAKLFALQYQGPYQVIGEWLQWKLVWNERILYTVAMPLEAIIAIVIVVTLGFCIAAFDYYRKQQWLIAGAITLIILGALSNLYDRFWYGAVIDYIHIAERSTANIADLMIMGSVIAIAIHVWKQNGFKNE